MKQASSATIDRYEIIRVLGRGRMGEVILAQDKSLGRRVAIRRPGAGGHDGFHFEAKAANLRHPNIPTVYQIGEHEGQPFIAMEYVEGETVEQIIESKRELDLISRLRIIEQLCSALGYAHEKGLVHLNIKPANIIVQPDGTAKVLNFGIAAPEEGKRHTGRLSAMHSESHRAGRVDGSADIFAAGVVLFNLLTSTDPFAAGSAPSSMNQAHTDSGTLLLDHLPALDQMLARSLAGNPEDRYQTGEDFADAVRDIIKILKRIRVSEMVHDAERLKAHGYLVQALAVLDQASRLDPSHAAARKLRRVARDEQQRIRRAERLREHLRDTDEALLNGKLDEALHHLRDAQFLDPSSAELKARIKETEEKKRRTEISARTLAAASEVKMRGDVAGALHMVAFALEKDPDNHQLQTMKASLLGQVKAEAQRDRLLDLQASSARALAAEDYDEAEKALGEAAAIDPSNPVTLKRIGELAQAREMERNRAEFQKIELQVDDLVRSEAYGRAAELIREALDKFPGEPVLHRLKAQVEAEASRYDIRHIVDVTIAQANELVANSPLEALTIVRKMLENIPGEERLVALEKEIRGRVEAN